MQRNRSLHIGVNVTDRKSFGYTKHEKLQGCRNDARAMRRIARGNNYDTVCLIDEKATFGAVEKYIRSAAAELRSGDTFLLTFSGHGVRNGGYINENDGYDEGIALRDLIMWDNYIDVFLRSFHEGVGVILVMDCCHSHTIYGFHRKHRRRNQDRLQAPGNPEIFRNRLLDRNALDTHVDEHRKDYRKLDERFRREGSLKEAILADIVVLSACDDNELAADGPDHGVFTGCMLKVLQHGGEPEGTPFKGTYKELIDKIRPCCGNAQVPQYTALGIHSGDTAHTFFQGPPFSTKRK